MPRRSKRSLSLGNDLPHMPEAPRESILLPPQSYGRTSNGAQAPPIPPLTTSTSSDGTLTASSTRDNFKQYPQCADDDLLDDEAANAMLLSRETQRLRLMTPLKLKRRARIAAGAAVLPLIGLTSYCLARYVIAWLHFGAPITFNPDGTTAAAAGGDPLLRTMSLLSVILTSYSLLLFLLSALYLRFTRTTSTATSIATPTIFFAVLLAGTIAIAMSLANVGLIVAWHKYYGLEKHKGDQTARTRDVARRCAGQWEFDLIWGAPLVGQEACTQEGGEHAVQLFLVAAALRAALYLVFVVLFLHLLRRYNRLLRLGPDTLLIPGKAPVDGDEEKLMHGGKAGGTVKESAEMHHLLAEQRAAAGHHHHYHPHGEVLNDETTLTSPDAEKAAALLGDARTGRGIDTHGGYAVTMASVPPSASSTPLAPPRLSRFNWQRGEPSHGAPADMDHDDAGYEQYAHAQQGSTGADGWGAAIYRRLWGASGHAAVPMREDDEENLPTLGHDAYYSRDLEAAARAGEKHQQHSKGPSRLGISGWFGRGGDGASDNGEEDEESEAGHGSTQADTSLTRHERTPSQERRRLAHRHAASARRSSAGVAATPSLPGSRRNSSSSVESQKYGDDLPAMPGLTDVPPPQPRQQQQQRASSSRSRSSSASPTMPTPTLPPRPTASPAQPSSGPSNRPSVPSYVRHLGRMVQKLPSIKSGDGDGSSSRNASESSAAAPLPSPGLAQQPAHGHGHASRGRRSSSSSGGEQWRSLGGVEEEGEEEHEGATVEQKQPQQHHQEGQAERAFPGAWQW